MRKHIALFAGLGGFVASCERSNIETIFATDLEQHCVDTLKKSFPKVPVAQCDIRKLKLSDFVDISNEVDLLSAGFPCQSFSTAGDNLGFEDERGKLFFEITRLIKELKFPPKVLLLENVPYLKLFDNGSRLQIVIHELRSLGYWVNDAQAIILKSREISGTPQNRERLYIVAFHSSYFKRNYFKNDFETVGRPQELSEVLDITIRQEPSLYLDTKSKYYEMLKQSMKKNGGTRLYQIRRVGVRACPPNICPTLTANMGGGGHNVPFVEDQWGIRKLSISECLKLQGYRQNEIIFPDHLTRANKYTMIGNAIHAGTVEKIIKSIQFDKEKINNDRLELSS